LDRGSEPKAHAPERRRRVPPASRSQIIILTSDVGWFPALNKEDVRL